MTITQSPAATPDRAARSVQAAFATAFAVLLTLFLTPAQLAQAQTFDSGHVDAFLVTAPDGQLHLSLQEDVTGSHVEHAGDDVVLSVSEDAWSTATEGVDGIGAATYFLPQTQDPALLWPGWDTQPAGAAGFEEVAFDITDISGPGSVYAFETSGFGSVNAVTDSGSLELASGESITQPYPAHRHVNWAFTDPGTYTMTVQARSNGQTSNAVTYTWQVGNGGSTPSADDADSDAAGTEDGTEGRSQASSAGTTGGSGNRAGGDASDSATSAAGGSGADAGASASECVAGIVPKVKDDTVSPAEWRDAEGATFYLSDAASAKLPEAIGPIPAGQAWMIGSTQVDGVPWLGANTQHPTMREHIPGDVTWELADFKGPGSMMVFSQGQLGEVVGQEWFRGSDTRAEGAYAVPPNTHAHPNWVFSAPGTYEVTIRHSGATAQGSTLSGQATLRFVVGGDKPEGAFDNGHFDLGAEVNPEGGDCAGAQAAASGAQSGTGAAGGAAGKAASASSAGTGHQAGARGAQLANTGSGIMPTGIAVLGLGMLFLGLGIARWAVAKAQA